MICNMHFLLSISWVPSCLFSFQSHCANSDTWIQWLIVYYAKVVTHKTSIYHWRYIYKSSNFFSFNLMSLCLLSVERWAFKHPKEHSMMWWPLHHLYPKYCCCIVLPPLPYSFITSGFSLGFFWVVQHHLDCLVHHLDHNRMQLCTTWVQSKVMEGYSQLCYSYVNKACTRGTAWSCVLLWSL